MTYAMMGKAYQTVFLSMTLLLAVGQMYHALRLSTHRRTLPMVVLWCGTAALLLALTDAAKGFPQPLAALVARRPAYQIGGAIVLDWVLTMAAISSLRLFGQTRLTAASIKESTDDLPSGLCFYTREGMPLLVNRVMRRLCMQFTGHWLDNGTDFWARLQKPVAGVVLVKAGRHPMLMTVDGRVWSFTRRLIRMRGLQVFEVIASDTTEQYVYSCQLQAENQQLEGINARLRQHARNIDRATRDQEILAARIRIHDEMGRALLTTRYYLSQRQGSASELLTMWKGVEALMRNEAQPVPASGALAQLQAAAAAVGVQVRLTGQLPENDPAALRTLLNAGRECLTNAVRHGAAHTLDMTVSQTATEYAATFANDGRPPVGRLTEGGGLSGLRRAVEREGGSMTVVSQPRLSVSIRIPKTGDERI